jgi:hypothetical protein
MGNMVRPVRIPPGSTPPQDWLDKAAALTEQLKNAPDDKTRIALVFANRKLWRDKRLLDWLTGLHYRKCWYSEARESVSSYHVDHFRPKGRAAQMDGTERSGYWWLTFDWKNYRLSGQLLNVKKRDRFPVQVPGVAQANLPMTLDLEGRLLLDPLRDEAWLVSFERTDDGECIAGPSPDVDNAQDLERVEFTIDVLGLNRLDALKQNRADVWDKCVARIQDSKDAGTEQVLHTREALRLVAAKALAEMCSERAEFSSVAKACVAKLAPTPLKQSVDDILNHPDLFKIAA